MHARTHAFLLTHEHAVHSCNKRDVRALQGDRCVRVDAVRQCVVTCVRVCRCDGSSLRGRSLCVGLECVLGRSALTFRRGRAMVSRLLLRAG